MAGWTRMPRHPLNDGARGFHEGPPPIPLRYGPPLPSHPATLEEEFMIQRGEIHRLHAENRHLVEDHMSLYRELMILKDETHSLSELIPKLQAEKEAHIRDLIERGLKLEAELRAIKPLRTEVIQLRSKAQKLNALKQEMTTQIQGLKQDLNRLKAENRKIPAMRVDLEGFCQELVRARTAFEYEKKANMEQVEHKQAMEKNLVSMVREVEKLRAELIGTDNRAVRPGGSGYGLVKGSPEMGYLGPFADAYGGEKGFYGANSWGNHEKRGPPRR
ncbi:protein FLX-like 3 [Aristolochia californica]|uniref:protein FLX-like 3 n=1 Tax=Aristolochia californica TaxID=171875 RepID=UPI0035D6C6CE